MRREIFLLALALFSLTAGPLHAFDWPQDAVVSDNFYSYFGQLRGGGISGSLIFKDNSVIRACDSGSVAVVIGEHSDDFGWFESTLGNAVIIAHDNSLCTVYANLDAGSVSEEAFSAGPIESGTELGESGNSGWQEGDSCLEFQVLDTRNKSAVNPRVLMPRMGRELVLEIGDLVLVDKKGGNHRLIWERAFPAGVYYLYRDRQRVAVPYRTVVAVNGATVEGISYDALTETNGRLCAMGNSPYPVEMLYPDSKRQLLGAVQLTRGRNTLSVTLLDILGVARTVTYTLDIN